jgi:hypothetical protein
MPSFELRYDEDNDVLEVTFASPDERLARSFALNDHIFLYADPSFNILAGMAFYNYSSLLLVSETELTELAGLSEAQRQACLNLLLDRPASLFFDLTDPDQLIARVIAPDLEPLVLSSYP